MALQFSPKIHTFKVTSDKTRENPCFLSYVETIVVKISSKPAQNISTQDHYYNYTNHTLLEILMFYYIKQMGMELFDKMH